MAASICLRAACRYLRKSNYKRFSRSLWITSRICQSEGNDTDNKQTHFGFEYIPEEEKEGRVYEVFKNVASRYDLMNDAMSVGVHRLWKDHFIQRLSPTEGTQLLDVAGGTGDIAIRYLQYLQIERENLENNFNDDITVPRDIEAQSFGIPPQYNLTDESDSSSNSSSSDNEDESTNNFSKTKQSSHVTVCDINQEMLDVGKEKALNLGFSSDMTWIKGNAESLPFNDNTFDAYTIAFGIRNCTHVDKVIEESYRVLKPGGRFMCLEFSQVNNAVLRDLYDSYSFQVIPVLGQVLARDWKSYQYLVESIRQFPSQEEFAGMIQQAGFSFVTYENLTFGVAAIHSGFKL